MGLLRPLNFRHFVFTVLFVLQYLCFVDVAPPSIDNLPNSVSFLESKPGDSTTSLFTFETSDPDNDTVHLSIDSVVPNVVAFRVAGTEFYLDINPSFSYANQQSYAITIKAEDSNGESTTKILTFDLIPNTKPQIQGLPSSISKPSTTAIGTIVYTLNVNETDPFTCTIASQSTNGVFGLQKTSGNYEIITNQALTENSYDVNINCEDDWGSTEKKLQVLVTQETPPVFNGYPKSFSVIESAAGGSTEHTVDVTNASSCSMSVDPPTTAFQYDSATKNINLVTTHGLRFNTQNSYTITMTCTNAGGSTNTNITVNVLKNTRPVIAPLDPVQIAETVIVKTELASITVTETDTYNCTIPTSNIFSLEPTGSPAYKLYLKANGLNHVTDSKEYVTVTCSDYWGSHTQTLELTVLTSPFPVINSLPDRVEISENQKLELSIWDLSYSDADDCFISEDKFDLRKDGTGFHLFVPPNPQLEVTTYPVVFTCTDYQNNVPVRNTTATLFIDVKPNVPPTFTSGTAVTINAQSTPINTVVHTCATTDPDHEAGNTNYSMVTNPSTSSFQINPKTCEIQTIVDLSCEEQNNYMFTINATDGKNTTSHSVSMTIQNPNRPPTLTSTPLNGISKRNFDENTMLLTTLYTPTIYDPDSSQTHSITYEATSERDRFSVSTTGITLAKELDHETVPEYTLTLYVEDQCQAKTGPYYVNIIVDDIPEQCGFGNDLHQASTIEGPKGQGRMNVGFQVSDGDSPDHQHTFSLVQNDFSKYFAIDPSSGEIYFNTDYDIDCPVSYPTNGTLIAKCTEQHGLTGTTSVTVRIDDINDNRPCFNAGGVTMYVNQYSKEGDIIGTLGATDCDSGLNAVVSYTGISPNGGEQHFTISTNGQVLFKGQLQTIIYNNMDYVFDITATDHGTPPLSCKTTLTISYREIVTTTTTTTTTAATPTSTNWWDKPEHVALVAILSLLSLFLLGLLTYLCCARGVPCGSPCRGLPSLSCRKCCKPRSPTKKIITPKEPKKPPKDPFDFFHSNDNKVQREMFSTKDQEGNTVIPMKI